MRLNVLGIVIDLRFIAGKLLVLIRRNPGVSGRFAAWL